MKLIALMVLLGLAAADRGTDRGRARQLSLRAGRSGTGSSNEDACKEVAAKFLPKPLVKERAIEAATDYCAKKYTAHNTYVCPHFTEFVTNALSDYTQEKPLSAAEFCSETEYHVLELRVQAPGMPNVANGTLEAFQIHGECVPTVNSAMEPEKAISKPKVPDFWYTFCTSQDCAHFVPSRTRWCHINHGTTPIHSNSLCLMMRQFTIDSMGQFSGGSLGAKDLCGLYHSFVGEQLDNAEAYDYVIHDGSKKNVYEPDDPQKALIYSRLMNGVAGHHLRDNAAKPVKPLDGGATGLRMSAAAFALVLSVLTAFHA